MSSNPCPLCGGKVVKNEIFCRSCQEIAKKSSLDNRLKSHPVDKKTPRTQTPKQESIVKNILQPEEPVLSLAYDNRKNKYLLLKALIIFLVAVIIGGLYYYSNNQKLEEEKNFWLQSVETNTSIAYSNYLQKHPDGEFSTFAEEKIREIKNLELSSWNVLKNSDDISAHFDYLREYPHSPYIHEIRNRIDQLAWQAALKDNTADSYDAYLENIKLGNYVGYFKDIAEEKHNYLSQLIILEGDEREAIEKQTKQILIAISSHNTDALAKLLGEKTLAYFKIYNLEKAMLIDSLKNITKRKELPAIDMQLIAKQTSIIKDTENSYFIDATVVEKRKNKENVLQRDTANIRLQLDKNKKLVKIERSASTRHQ